MSQSSKGEVKAPSAAGFICETAPTSEAAPTSETAHAREAVRMPEAADLALSRVNIHRRRLHLIADLDVTVHPGEILGVSGASGAGKTTLLRAIAGATGEYSGRIRRPEGRLAFVFQEPRLLPWLSARDNVLLTLDKRMAGRLFAAEEWLERVGLRDAMDLRPAQMSGGMRQRVAIARALVGVRQLILADEPTGALDTTTAESVMQLLRRRVDDGAACVLVTHEPRFAAWADRVVYLRDGKIVDEADNNG